MDTGKRKLFQIALASAGLNMSAWAAQQGYSHSAVSLILSNKMKSRKLSSQIDSFIDTELRRLKVLDRKQKVA